MEEDGGRGERREGHEVTTQEREGGRGRRSRVDCDLPLAMSGGDCATLSDTSSSTKISTVIATCKGCHCCI